MALLDTILKEWKIGPVYLICLDHIGEVHVFDGAHRIETLVDFHDNKFSIKKANSETLNWDTSCVKQFEGMYFKDLPHQYKRIVEDYSLNINYIEPDLNPVELATLWVRLNNSGAKLNQYEMYIPIYYDLYELLKEDVVKNWENTSIANKKSDKNKRGETSVNLMTLLALSQRTLPKKYDKKVYMEWRSEILGKTTTEIDTNFSIKKDEILDNLKNLRRAYKFLADNDLVKNHGYIRTEFMIIIGRIAYWFKNPTYLSRSKEDLIEYIRCILETTAESKYAKYGVKESNIRYKNGLLKDVDICISDIFNTNYDSRKFTPAQRESKLVEQKHICPMCNCVIKFNQPVECHHKKSFAEGGKTTMDNLAVVHEDCHKKYHLNSSHPI